MSRALPLLAVVALLAGGCGTSDDRDEARETVERFYTALQAGDGVAACEELSEGLLEQLASQSDCSGVITQYEYEGGEVVGTEVYITAAKVDLDGGESAFLGREDAGWKLTALACKPEEGKPADRPWECEVES